MKRSPCTAHCPCGLVGSSSWCSFLSFTVFGCVLKSREPQLTEGARFVIIPFYKLWVHPAKTVLVLVGLHLRANDSFVSYQVAQHEDDTIAARNLELGTAADNNDACSRTVSTVYSNWCTNVCAPICLMLFKRSVSSSTSSPTSKAAV